MAEPMTTTVSGWFEENGDFPENLEPDELDQQREDAQELLAEMAVVCTVCGDPNPAKTTDEDGVLKCESCLDDEVFEPCCYASTMHFGQGDHEWGCPNY